MRTNLPKSTSKGCSRCAIESNPPNIYNLRLFLTHVAKRASDVSSPELEDATNDLDQFYIPSRYPTKVGGPDGPVTAEDDVEALSWAESIATAIRPLLMVNDVR